MLDLQLEKPDSSVSERVAEAERRKKLKEYQPTWAEIFDTGYQTHTGKHKKGIFQLKNSEADLQKLQAVKEAIESGEISAHVTDRKKFSKSHALNVYRMLLEQRKEAIIAEMVQNIPENYHSVQTWEQLEQLVALAKQEQENAVDTETTGLHLENDEVVGMSVTLPAADQHYYIPFLHQNANVGEQLNKAEVMQYLQEELYDRQDLLTVMFNTKFDLHQLIKEGLQFKGRVQDAQEGFKILSENEQSYKLKKLANKWGKYFGYTDNSMTFEELFSKDPKDFYVTADYRLCYYYACKDTHLTYLLMQFIQKQMDKQPKLGAVYHDIEVPITEICFKMEQAGMPIDLEYAESYGKQLEAEIAELDREIKEFFGDINWNSPAQIQKRLFDELGLKPLDDKRSTDASALKHLAKTTPEIQKVLDYRKLSKLYGSFIEPIPQKVWSDNRIHGRFNQGGTKTGRFASDDPNLQNIPYPARPMFKAPEGKLIISADYSQIEPRVLAHMSGDKLLQEPYISGGDLYCQAAFKVYGDRYNLKYEQFLEVDDVSWREVGLPKHPRKLFKQGLLATMYNTSAFGLSSLLDISVEEAQQFIDDFHRNFPTAYQYAKDSIAFVDQNGYCETLHGRKRRFPDHVKVAKEYHRLKQQAVKVLGRDFSNVWQEKALPYKLKQQLGAVSKSYNTVVRQIVNARTQGTAAEIMKLGMIHLQKFLDEKGSEWKMIATIHDEVLLEVPESITEKDFEAIEYCMTSAVALAVPLKTDIAVMRRWSEDVTLQEWLEKGADCFDSEGWKV